MLPPPELEEGAEPRGGEAEPSRRSAVRACPSGGRGRARAGPPGRAAPAAQTEAPPAQQVEETPAAGEAQPPPPDQPAAEHVEPDQETHERVLQEELAKGTDRRVAEGRAKAAAIRAARRRRGRLLSFQEWIFTVLAVVGTVAAIRLVTARNVVHAALLLVVSLAMVAGVYLVLAAEFVAWVQVLIYVGAIVVLLLFGLMLTRAPIGREALDNQQRAGLRDRGGRDPGRACRS